MRDETFALLVCVAFFLTVACVSIVATAVGAAVDGRSWASFYLALDGIMGLCAGIAILRNTVRR